MRTPLGNAQALSKARQPASGPFGDFGSAAARARLQIMTPGYMEIVTPKVSEPARAVKHPVT
jgi:hypothetical protein